MASQLRRAFVGFRILFTHKENPSFLSVKRFYREKPCLQDSKQIRGAFMGNPFFFSVKRFYGEKPCPQDSNQVLRKPLDDKAATEVAVAVAVPDSPTKDAGSEEEPTAASLVHDLENTDTDKIPATLHVKLGHHGLSVSVLVFYPVAEEPELLTYNTDAHLDVDDFVKRIVHWLASGLKRAERKALLEDKKAFMLITKEVQNALRNLSFFYSTSIDLSFKTTGRPKLRIGEFLSRSIFEQLCSDLLERVQIQVELSLRTAEESSALIDSVLLEIESITCIPVFLELIKKLTGMYPYKTITSDGVLSLDGDDVGGSKNC